MSRPLRPCARTRHTTPTYPALRRHWAAGALWTFSLSAALAACGQQTLGGAPIVPVYEVDEVIGVCAQPPYAAVQPSTAIPSATCEGPAYDEALTVLASRDAVEALELCDALPGLAAELLARYEGAEQDGSVQGPVDFERHDVVITARQVDGTDGLVLGAEHATWISDDSDVAYLRFDVVDSSGTCTPSSPHVETLYTLWVVPRGVTLNDCSRLGSYCGDASWMSPSIGWSAN